MSVTISPHSAITTGDVSESSQRRLLRPRRIDQGAPRRRDDGPQGELVATIMRAASYEAACRQLVNELANRIGGGTVVVGDVHRSEIASRLIAVSNVNDIDRRSETTRSIESALNEVLLVDGPTYLKTCPETPSEKRTVPFFSENSEKSGQSPRVSRDETGGGHQKTLFPLKSHEQLLQRLGGNAALGRLLSTDGTACAVVLWFDDGGFGGQKEAQRVLDDVDERVTLALRCAKRVHLSATQRLVEQVANACRDKRMRIAITAVGLTAALLLVPLQHKVACNAVVEPTQRRFIAAPFDATLVDAKARPGDVVRGGDVLATLDGRQIRWDLAAAQAELAQASKRYDAALAAQQPAEAEIARLEARRLELRLAQLRRHESNLSVKSPIDGVILKGELQDKIGATLATGQPLLEVAPLDPLVVEVAVENEQLRFVQQGHPVEIRFDSASGQTFDGTIERIRPQSEVADQQSVFIAEVAISNADLQLRPGMQGRAKIASGRRALGWLLFHRPWEAATSWLGW